MSKEKPSRGARIQQVGRAGEYFVVAEINKRGGFAVTFAGNMPKIDVMACNHDRSHTVYIQVKTKRGGSSWHSSIIGSKPTRSNHNETNFWVFVDLGDPTNAPTYWVVPDWWMKNDIHKAHQSYLKSHGGTRARNPESTHHAVEERRLKKWKGKWDILGIFEVEPATPRE